MIKKYHGIIPPIVTPITENEEIDEEALRQLVERCVIGGLHGIFVAGSNGECMQLTQKERNRAIKIVIDQTAGRIPVVCGIMDSSTKRVIENLKELEDMGGTCAAVTSVFYSRHCSQNESIRHFEKINDASNIDLIMYNMPSMTGLAFTPDTVITVAQMEHVKAYKDSSPNYGGFLQVMSKLKDTEFSCLQGVTSQAISALLMGADGYVPALAPLFPELFADSYEAGISGDVEKAQRYNELIRQSSLILSCSKNLTAAAKYAISTLGFMDKRVIMPQDGTTPEEELKIRAQIEYVKKLYEEEKCR